MAMGATLIILTLWMAFIWFVDPDGISPVTGGPGIHTGKSSPQRRGLDSPRFRMGRLLFFVACVLARVIWVAGLLRVTFGGSLAIHTRCKSKRARSSMAPWRRLQRRELQAR